jgi:methionine synthase II (cobalamin-independent)
MNAIPTTAIGSWPIPFGQRATLKRFYAGDLNEATAYDTLVQAARIAMDEQLACGLTQIAGGEVFAPDFVHHVPPRLEGLKAFALRDTRRGYQGLARYVRDGPLGAPRGTGHAAAFRREHSLEPRLGKASIPSPYTVTLRFDATEEPAHSRDELTAIVAAEIHEMVSAGASEIQVDAPSEALTVIARDASGKAALAHARELADWIAAPFVNVGAHVCQSVHLCLGDISRKPATENQNLRLLLPLMQALEGRIDRVLIECSYFSQWREHALLADLPAGFEVVAGISDVKSPPQSVDELKRKIEALAPLLGERLLLSTSCRCGRMPHDEAIRLNRNLVKASAEIGNAT